MTVEDEKLHVTLALDNSLICTSSGRMITGFVPPAPTKGVRSVSDPLNRPDSAGYPDVEETNDSIYST